MGDIFKIIYLQIFPFWFLFKISRLLKSSYSTLSGNIIHVFSIWLVKYLRPPLDIFIHVLFHFVEWNCFVDHFAQSQNFGGLMWHPYYKQHKFVIGMQRSDIWYRNQVNPGLHYCTGYREGIKKTQSAPLNFVSPRFAALLIFYLWV